MKLTKYSADHTIYMPLAWLGLALSNRRNRVPLQNNDQVENIPQFSIMKCKVSTTLNRTDTSTHTHTHACTNFNILYHRHHHDEILQMLLFLLLLLVLVLLRCQWVIFERRSAIIIATITATNKQNKNNTLWGNKSTCRWRRDATLREFQNNWNIKYPQSD